jgi:hypothetical protein
LSENNCDDTFFEKNMELFVVVLVAKKFYPNSSYIFLK